MSLFCRIVSLVLVALLLVGSTVQVVHAGDKSEKWLRVAKSASKVAKSEAGRAAKKWVRNHVVRRKDLQKYGLRVPNRISQEASHRPLVILVHGFNSTPQHNLAPLAPVRKAGLAVGTFAYPNDHNLTQSAALLSRELRDFAHQNTDQRIALVTHSMGGLVARACIENPDLDPGNVDRLIMVAPPSQGTLVARLGVCADVWEHGFFRKSGGPFARLRDSVVDGLAEAADDLEPGSRFLTRLNARGRNQDVQYTIILGTGGKIREWEMDLMRTALKKTAHKIPGMRTSSRKLERCLGDLDEVIDGKGDGVVAVRRGLLPGVDDVVLLPFGHMSVTGPPKTTAIREVHQEILMRLEESPSQ